LPVTVTIYYRYREEQIKALSYSQISQYQKCPLCYKLQYIDHLKTKPRWYFSFGSTIHSCVERFFKVNTPTPPSLEELLEFYEQNWISTAYESAEEEANYKAYGREILTKFREIHSVDFRIPIALERGFYLDIDGIKLRGFIDRVDKLDSGGLSIIDYKTNKELFTTDYVENDLQLTIYQLAAEQTWQLPVEMLTLYHLRSNTACSCPPHDAERIEEVRRLVHEVAESIVQEKFPATENQFCPCDFPEHCPYYKHQYLIETPEPAQQQQVMPGIAAADEVEKYAALQAQIKELQEQLNEAKRKIIEYCQSEEMNRVFGGEHEITYRLIERTGYNEEDIRAVLEPAGLWDRVQSFDQSLLKKIISDAATTADIKQQLESLKKVTSSYPQLYLKKRGAEEEEE
jgi:putative RecB family exonuclease